MFVVVDLLEHGDLFSQFIDTAEDKLRKEVREVSLLQLAVQTSTRSQRGPELLAGLIQHLNLIQEAAVPRLQQFTWVWWGWPVSVK